jgi:hypothetical protein
MVLIKLGSRAFLGSVTEILFIFSLFFTSITESLCVFFLPLCVALLPVMRKT